MHNCMKDVRNRQLSCAFAQAKFGVNSAGNIPLFKFRVAAQAALRVLLAGGAIVGAVQLFRLVLLPEIESAFHPGDTVTSALRRAGILLSALLAYWAYVRFAERRNVIELRLAPAGIALGALSGAALISITTAALFAAGIYEVTQVRGLQSELLGVAGLILVAAMLEEIAFRGALFQILEGAWGTIPALWLQSLLFSLQHIANIEDTASPMEMLTTVVSGTLIGAFWTMIFVTTRNLWIVAAHHAAWNFAVILTGTPLSGIEAWRAIAPIESRYNGPAWLTGGVFGPEDSIITIAVMVLGLVALLHTARKNNALIAPKADQPPALAVPEMNAP